MTTRIQKKRVKAWAVVDANHDIPSQWSMIHSVFSPRIYTTESSAYKVADVVVTETVRLKVVPCEITYKIKKQIYDND